MIDNKFIFIILIIIVGEAVSSLESAQFCLASNLSCKGKYDQNAIYKTECKKACIGKYACTDELCTSDKKTCIFFSN